MQVHIFSVKTKILKSFASLKNPIKSLKNTLKTDYQMANQQSFSRRKPSGGRLVLARGKRLRELARFPTHTKIGKKQTKTIRAIGGNRRTITTVAEIANVYNPKTKKYSQEKIESVLENPANRHFVRRNIMTKGTIVKTPKGNARIVSRPGQEGVINAVLVK